jgi:hypothetical protein
VITKTRAHFVAAVVPDLPSFVTPIVTGLSLGVTPIVSGLSFFVTPIMSGLSPGVAAIVTGLPSFVAAIMPGFAAIVSGLVPSLAAIVPGFVPVLTAIVTGLVTGLAALTPRLPPVLAAVAAAFPDILAVLGPALTALLPALVEVLAVLLLPLRETLVEVLTPALVELGAHPFETLVVPGLETIVQRVDLGDLLAVAAFLGQFAKPLEPRETLPIIALCMPCLALPLRLTLAFRDARGRRRLCFRRGGGAGTESQKSHRNHTQTNDVHGNLPPWPRTTGTAVVDNCSKQAGRGQSLSLHCAQIACTAVP